MGSFDGIGLRACFEGRSIERRTQRGIAMVHTHPAAGRLACDTCGSIYDVHQGWIITRDKDTIACMICGQPFVEWNGAVVYNVRLVAAAPWPKPPST
jgi:hypothetical protein